jgi:hypothetical protein
VAAPPAAVAPTGSQQHLTSSDAGVAAASSSPLLPRPRSKSAPLPQAAGKADIRSSPAAVTNTTGSSPEPCWSDGSHSDSPHPSQADGQGHERDASPAALQQQQQPEQQQQNTVTGPLLVSTRVVGRQHQSSSWPPATGSELLLQREATNPVDPCAILVRIPSPQQQQQKQSSSEQSCSKMCVCRPCMPSFWRLMLY